MLDKMKTHSGLRKGAFVLHLDLLYVARACRSEYVGELIDVAWLVDLRKGFRKVLALIVFPRGRLGQGKNETRGWTY
jgi:hypothetical protein